MDLRRYKQAFGRQLELRGFRRKGLTWFIENAELITLLNLQKDMYGPSYFLNLAFWLKALGEPAAKPPPESQCHLRFRVESVFPALRPSLIDILNLASDFTDEEREANIEQLIAGSVVPFLLATGSVIALRAQLSAGNLDDGFVDARAREYLSVP